MYLSPGLSYSYSSDLQVYGFLLLHEVNSPDGKQM